MNNRPVFFNEILPKVADLISAQTFPKNIEPLVVRDIHGRVRIALDLDKKDCLTVRSSLDRKSVV